MGKGNMLLGQLRGSVGDLTFSVRGGSQISRVRVRVVKNPRSEAQQIQRMLFATAVRAYMLLKSICNHSFENVAYGADSQARFLSLNLKRLRAYYPISADPQLLANTPVTETMGYVLPSGEGDVGAGIIVSHGTLPEIVPNLSVDGIITSWGSPIRGVGETSTPSVKSVLDALGALPGDQITVLSVENGRLSKSRYVTRSDASETELALPWMASGQGAAFDNVKTDVRGPGIEATNEYVYIDSRGLVAIILSRKDSTGKWLRSPARLYTMTDEAPEYQASYALPIWLYSGTDIETTDARYLNNADV